MLLPSKPGHLSAEDLQPNLRLFSEGWDRSVAWYLANQGRMTDDEKISFARWIRRLNSQPVHTTLSGHIFGKELAKQTDSMGMVICSLTWPEGSIKGTCAYKNFVDDHPGFSLRDDLTTLLKNGSDNPSPRTVTLMKSTDNPEASGSGANRTGSSTTGQKGKRSLADLQGIDSSLLASDTQPPAKRTDTSSNKSSFQQFVEKFADVTPARPRFSSPPHLFKSRSGEARVSITEAEYTELRARVDDTERRLGEMRAEIHTLRSAIPTLRSAIHTLRSALDYVIQTNARQQQQMDRTFFDIAKELTSIEE